MRRTVEIEQGCSWIDATTGDGSLGGKEDVP